MTQQAQQFAEAMAKVADDYEATMRIDNEWSGKYKIVRFVKHDNQRGLRFEDDSKLFFGKEGTLILPANTEGK